jgi:hypothetical protein
MAEKDLVDVIKLGILRWEISCIIQVSCKYNHKCANGKKAEGHLTKEKDKAMCLQGQKLE